MCLSELKLPYYIAVSVVKKQKETGRHFQAEVTLRTGNANPTLATMVLTVLIKEYILHIDVMAAWTAETLNGHFCFRTPQAGSAV